MPCPVLEGDDLTPKQRPDLVFQRLPIDLGDFSSTSLAGFRRALQAAAQGTVWTAWLDYAATAADSDGHAAAGRAGH